MLDDTQPNSRHCFVCGLANPFGLKLRFHNSGVGEVSAICTLPDEFQGYPGIVHGGIVCAMLDEAAGRSLMGGDSPRFMYTARMDIRYRSNVPVRQPLRLVGKVERSKSRTATAKSVIMDMGGTILAEALVVLVNIPNEFLEGTDLDALGWRVYSEEEFHAMGGRE